MTKKEAVGRLEELAEEIYNILDEMKEIIREVSPEEFERARGYWMAHIDGALQNRAGWLGGSFISLQDTIEAIEEEAIEEED